MQPARERHLKHAPIMEAVIDIRVTLPPEFGIEEFKPLVEIAKKDYPDLGKRVQAQFQFSASPAMQSSSAERRQDGWVLKNAEGNQLLQFRLDGFTLNRLPQYPRWEDLIEEAMRWWRQYEALAKPSEVTRIGVRYINRLPLPDSDLTKYVLALPLVPPHVEGEASYFFQQVILKPAPDLTLQITQSIEEALDDGKQPYILDIDVGRTGQIASDNAGLLAQFEELRHYKNTVFFNSISEEASCLFE